MPLLQILTRVYKRPTWLQFNQASLRVQTDPDWAQTLLVDDVGIGCEAANARLAEVEPQADYVWILDDDDYCIAPRMVETLRSLVYRHDAPPAVIMRTIDDAFGVLPPDVLWCKPPVENTIGASHIFTRADVWLAHRHKWATMRYAADYDFIASVWAEHGQAIVWHDLIVRSAMRISHGLPETV